MTIREFLEMTMTDEAKISIWSFDEERNIHKGTVMEILESDNEELESVLDEEMDSWDYDFLTQEIGINF